MRVLVAQEPLGESEICLDGQLVILGFRTRLDTGRGGILGVALEPLGESKIRA